GKLAERVGGSGQSAILPLTSGDEPLHDELLGIAVSLPDESVYVPVGHRPRGGPAGTLFAPAELDGRGAVEILRPVLEDAKIRKDGHDLKRELVAWRRRGIELRGRR